MSFNSKTYHYKGNLLRIRGNYLSASQCYDTAKNFAKKELAGICVDNVEDYKDAKQKLISIYVDSAKNHRFAKEYDKALDELDSLFALYPYNLSIAYNELGNLCLALAKANDISKAVKDKLYKMYSQYCSPNEENPVFDATSGDDCRLWLTSLSNWLFYLARNMYSKALALDNNNIPAYINNSIMKNSMLSELVNYDCDSLSKVIERYNLKYKKSKRTQYEPRKILTILHYLRAISRINVNVFCYVDECLSDGSVLRVKYTIGEDCVKCKHYKACELQKYNIPAIVDDFDYAMKYDIDKVYTDKILYACGLAYLYHERYSDAISAFTSVIESSNANESIKLYSHYYRGLAYAILQDNDNCIKDFTSFINNEKNACIDTCFDAYLLMHAHYYKGLKLIEQKNARFALADFIKVTELYWDYIKKSNKNLNLSLGSKHRKYLAYMKLITIKSCANIINIYTNHYINSKEKCVRYINSAKKLSDDSSFNYKGYSFDLILFVDSTMIDGMLHIIKYEALDYLISTTF